MSYDVRPLPMNSIQYASEKGVPSGGVVPVIHFVTHPKHLLPFPYPVDEIPVPFVGMPFVMRIRLEVAWAVFLVVGTNLGAVNGGQLFLHLFELLGMSEKLGHILHLVMLLAKKFKLAVLLTLLWCHADVIILSIV